MNFLAAFCARICNDAKATLGVRPAALRQRQPVRRRSLCLQSQPRFQSLQARSGRAAHKLRGMALPLVQALKCFERDGFSAFAAGFAARDLLFGREVRTTRPDVPQGVARGVSAQGALLVETPGGSTLAVASGEVSVRLDEPAPAA